MRVPSWMVDVEYPAVKALHMPRARARRLLHLERRDVLRSGRDAVSCLGALAVIDGTALWRQLSGSSARWRAREHTHHCDSWPSTVDPPLVLGPSTSHRM